MTEMDRQPDAQGTFSRYPVPRLLYYLYKKQLVGWLAVQQPERFSGRVFFRDGLPVFAELPFSQDVLGQVLLERGLIDEAAFNRSLQELARGGKLQGRLLMEMGALDVAGLIHGLRLQLQRKLTRLFPLDQATFAIYSGDHQHGLEAEAAHVQADPLRVIYHGVRHYFDDRRMSREINKVCGMQIRVRPELADIVSRYGMDEESEALISLLQRGPVQFERLFEVSNIGPLMTKMLLYTLWVTEALVVTRPSASEPVGPTGLQMAVGSGEHSAISQARRPPAQTAPEVAALAQAFIDGTASSDATADPEDLTVDTSGFDEDSGTPVITSRPEHEEPPDTAAAIAGREGVYELPAAGSPQPCDQSRYQGAPRPDVPPQAQAECRPNVPRQPQQPQPSAGAAEASAGAARAPRRRRTSGSAAASSPGKAPAQHDSTHAPVAEAGPAAQHHERIRQMLERIESGNFYEVLGVEPSASEDQIRDAYFKLAKDFHPDRVRALALDDISDEAQEVFRVINEAHSTLANAEQRRSYDEELAGGGDKKAAAKALNAEFTFQKGLVHLRKKSFREAREHFEEALRLNPNEGEHQAYVAWTMYCDPKTDKQKTLLKIKELLLQSIQLSPNSPTCHYFLGEIYLALNEERRAHTCFEKVLEIKPDHLDAERHLRILRMRREKHKEQKRKKSGLFSRFKKK